MNKWGHRSNDNFFCVINVPFIVSLFFLCVYLYINEANFLFPGLKKTKQNKKKEQYGMYQRKTKKHFKIHTHTYTNTLQQ